MTEEKEYLFVGGPADGKRIKVPAGPGKFGYSHKAEGKSYYSDVFYERKYITHGAAGEDITALYGLCGVPVKDVIVTLIAGYPRT